MTDTPHATPHDCGHHHHHSPTPHHEHAHAASACEHAHPHSAAACEHPHIPARGSKVGLWVAGIATAVGLGAYLLNSHGKAVQKEKSPEPWSDRVAQKPEVPQARSL